MHNSFLYSCKKMIKPAFTKNNTVHSTVTCNIHAKFELSRMHCLDAVMFILIHPYTRTQMHTYMHQCENSFKEFTRPEDS